MFACTTDDGTSLEPAGSKDEASDSTASTKSPPSTVSTSVSFSPSSDEPESPESDPPAQAASTKDSANTIARSHVNLLFVFIVNPPKNNYNCYITGYLE